MPVRLVHDATRPLRRAVASVSDAFLRGRALLLDDETPEIRREIERLDAALEAYVAAMSAAQECAADALTRAIVAQAERAYRTWRVEVVIFPRFGGRPDYAASAATLDFNSNSIGLVRPLFECLLTGL